MNNSPDNLAWTITESGDINILNAIYINGNQIYGSSLLSKLDGYVPINIIGSGMFGTVFLICKGRYNCRACKIVEIKTTKNAFNYQKEVIMQKKFMAIGMAPKIYDTFSFTIGTKTYAGIIMEKIDGTIEDLLKNPLPVEFLDRLIVWIGDIIETLCANDIIHGDMHPGNLGFKLLPNASDGISVQILFIDFGWSCCEKSVACYPEFELLQFIRVLYLYKVKNSSNPFNLNYLLPKFIKLYNDNYTPLLDTDFSNVQKNYDIIHKRVLAYVKEMKIMIDVDFI